MAAAPRRLALVALLLGALRVGQGGRLPTARGEGAPSRPSVEMARPSSTVRRALPLLAAFLGATATARGQQAPARRASGVAATMRIIDKDGDGIITFEEFMKPARRSVGHWEGNQHTILEWYEKLFDKADLDGSDGLNDDETKFLLCLVTEITQALNTETTTSELNNRDNVGAPTTYHLFQAADINEDGEVDRFEFSQLMARHAVGQGWGEVDPQIKAWGKSIFKRANVLTDDVLNYDEFQFATYLMDQDIREGKFTEKRFVGQMFKSMDMNRDGKITDREAKDSIARDRKSTDAADKERAEIFERVWKHAPRFDKNFDGALDHDEMQEFAKELGSMFEQEFNKK